MLELWEEGARSHSLAKREEWQHWAQLLQSREYQEDILSHNWRLLLGEHHYPYFLSLFSICILKILLFSLWNDIDIQTSTENNLIVPVYLHATFNKSIWNRSCFLLFSGFVFFSFTVHRRFLNFQSWIQFVLPTLFPVAFSTGVCDPISLCAEFEYLLVTDSSHSYHLYIWNQ